MENLEKYDDGVPAIADDSIVEVARKAKARIEAVKEIKQMALMVTNAYDWTDQNGKPYLQASGSEKVANLFNISWRIDEPRLDVEESGHFTYTFKGEFTLGGRSIEVEGSRSSKDPFFKRYDWVNGKKVEKPVSEIDRRDVKMSAMTNLLGNGITRILGIRNLTWDDLRQYAGVLQAQVGKIDYKKDGKDPKDLTPPKAKTQSPPPQDKPKEEDQGEGNSAKETLHDELCLYCMMANGEIDTNMYASVCREVSTFKGKNGKTGQEETKSFDDPLASNVSGKWAGAALGKLREKVKENA